MTPAFAPGEPDSVGEALHLAAAALRGAGVENDFGDARLLLAHALGAVPTWVYAHEERELPAGSWSGYCELVERRRRREPLQHLLGQQGFWSLRIGVGPEVLIPRPETEHLVEGCLEALAGIEIPRLADVGTGSGCVAIALAAELPLGRIAAVDSSSAALERARRNARELGFEDRIAFRLGDLAAPLRGGEPLDALAANLPYVSAGEWDELQPEVREHEPRSALVAGEEGTELLFRLIDEAPDVLRAGGWLGLEVGWTQARTVAARLAERGWADVGICEDFAGIERIVSARRPG